MAIDNFMNISKTKKIVILGGGTAGWMAAAAFSKFVQGTQSSVALIESDQIGTIGVGEATVPGIGEFNHFLGVSELDFIQSTQATFKLGILFQDWFKQDTTFFHPFAKYGAPLAGVDFYQCYLALLKQGKSYPLEDFCLATQIALSEKFVQPDDNPETPLAKFNYAYHFDASLYAKFLRRYAEMRKVTRIEGKLQQVVRNEDTGAIQSLVLESGLYVAGDIFIDCTGFSALLIDKTLGVDYLDWSEWLRCDRAVAVQSTSVRPPVPYTRSKALSAGWQWTIPLQHRVGNGYVYSSAHISDDEATAVMLSNTSGECLTEPRVIRFTAGMRRRFIEKNCIALGLASGFIEPLESTSISLIQTGIEKVMKLFPDLEFEDAAVRQANDWNEKEYSRLRDFIILHYKLNKRSDNDFWRSVAAMDVPDMLAHKISQFAQDGSLVNYELETFLNASWISMYNGFQVIPERSQLILDEHQQAQLVARFDSMRSAIRQGASIAIPHDEFLSTVYCPD